MKPLINIHTISDSHFNHWNINRLCNRGFQSLKHMDGTQTKRWNTIVKPHDIIIIVGDLIFTKGISQEVAKIIQSLNGRKILVHGNHDRKTYSWYLTHGIDFICDTFSWDFNHKKILFVHSPHDVKTPDLTKYHYIIHGHQHNSTPFIQKKRRCTFVNVSAEHLNYTPINLITLLNRLQQGYYKKKRNGNV